METIVNAFSYILKGGIMMIPIVLCSIIAVAIVVERLMFLKKSHINTENFMIKIKDILSRGKADEAIYLCANAKTPLASVLLAGLKSTSTDKEEIASSINEAGLEEIPKLEANLPVLSTITKISPLLGLLGTVMGMIKAFTKISTVGVGNPVVLASGISEALITTAAGLFVAIPAMVFYNYISEKIDRYIHDIEKSTITLLNTLTQGNDKQEVETKKVEKTEENK